MVVKKGCLIIVATLLMLSGCNDVRTSTSSSVEQQRSNQEMKKKEKPPIDIIQQKVNAMSIDEKIGQLIIAGVEGTGLTSNNRNLLTKDKVGGIIIMGGNVQNANQLKNLINTIKTQHQASEIPLFISTDEEGGRVSRMPPEINGLPTNEAIGKINNAAYSYGVGSILAKELKSFGFNMDFAPVLDINSNPNNPVIGDRSFSNRPDIVTKLGIQTMKGLQDNKVISVVKHFPGHGDTKTDSHLDLPIVDAPLQKLRSFELQPFRAAIEEGADGVMVAHILLRSLDNKNPASLSQTVITKLLREELDFNGVVFTDDLTMKAITRYHKIGEAAVLSIQAGADVVLVCHDYRNVTAVLNALKVAVNTNKITKARLDESVYRILTLKQKYQLSDQVTGPVNIKDINQQISELLVTKGANAR
ncbi:beta-N-acetylhexosaminidase [Bacillus massiliigorillae]|uniref:beta-N-acetylhexosaminidase n=1 Tax=Bacillus massiliigorillae TaxID=1243664 RepID=UPI00039CDA0A|nr:beta-N-acetylhexosaminidase [Bacillus massiliigorillae]